MSEPAERSFPHDMTWELLPDRFALVGFPEPADAEDLRAVQDGGPGQLVREGGESTLLLPEDRLEDVLARHPGAEVERGFLWVRFVAPMAWDVVGFLAHVTGALAEAGVPLGAVCGYSRDHLFVSERFENELRRVLAESFPERAR